MQEKILSCIFCIFVENNFHSGIEVLMRICYNDISVV